MRDGTEKTKRRGRPPAYDRQAALDAALEVFWERGFAHTSLDDLKRATNMNRPSLYAAFGDKRAIYRAALDRFRNKIGRAQSKALETGDPVTALTEYFWAALRLYLSGPGRGCMVFGTAVVEAVNDDELRLELKQTLASIDAALETWFAGLQARGELSTVVNAKLLAWQASATLLSLGIRARAGDGRKTLRAAAAASATLLLAGVS